MMLAILSTHPIQNQVPLWQALARDGQVPFEVWYVTHHGTHPSVDPEFARSFAWDIDTLSGYPHRLLDAVKGATPSGFWQCRLRERLRDRLRASGATAVWIQGWQVAAYWQAVREAKAAGVEVWLRGESNDLAPRPLWKRAIRRMELRWLFNRVDRFLYIGEANRRLYQSFGVPEARLYPAPYAVDNDRFSRQAEKLRPLRAELRRRWAIPDDAFCVLFCGKLVEKKRPLDLVEAARRLREEALLPNLHLLFAGSGPLAPLLRQSCHVVFDADVSPVQTPSDGAGSGPFKPPASFAGFLNQTEISQAYVAADCLVLPSDYGETWGLVVNEALASGLPCLVSEACGCAEELAGDSRSFPLADIPALAARVLNLGRNPANPVKPPSIGETVSSVVRSYHESGSPISGSAVAAERSTSR
jgi:glycosyltransferase involved in cell wall biosynthesis